MSDNRTPPNPPNRPGTPRPTGSSSGWREKDPMDIDTTPEKVKELSGRAGKGKKKPKRRPSGIPAESDDDGRDPDSSPEYRSRRRVRPVQYKPPPVNRLLFKRKTSIVGSGGPPVTAAPAEPGEKAEATGVGNKRRAESPRSSGKPKAQRRHIGPGGPAQGYDADTPEVPQGPVKPTQWIDDEDMDDEREESDDEPDPPSPTAGRALRRILKPTGTRNTSRMDRQALLAQAARDRQEFEELNNAFKEVSIDKLQVDWQPETSARPPPAPPGIPRPNIDWDAPLEEEPMVTDPPPPRAKMLKILRDAKKKLQEKRDKKKGKQQQGEQEEEEEDDELIWSGIEEDEYTSDANLSDGKSYHPYRPLVNQGIRRHTPPATRFKDGAGIKSPRAQEKKGNTKPDGSQYHPFHPLVNQGINRHAPQASKDKRTGEHGPPPSARPSRPVWTGQAPQGPTIRRVSGEENLQAAAQRVPSSGSGLRRVSGVENLQAASQRATSSGSLRRVSGYENLQAQAAQDAAFNRTPSFKPRPPSHEFTVKKRRAFAIHEDPNTGVADLYYNTTSLKRTGHVQKVKAGSGRVFSSRFHRRNGENFLMAFNYDIRYLIYLEILQSNARLVKLGRGAPLITAGLDIPPCNNQIMFTSRTIYMETFRIFYRINTFEIKVNWEHFYDPLYFLPADFGKAVRKINFVHDFKINPNLKDTLNLMKKVPVFYHYPDGPSTRVLDFEEWKDILRNLDYCHIEWKIETWVRHKLWAGADLEKQNLTKKDLWDGWDGIWVAIQMYKSTQKAGSQRTSSYLCYWDSWSDPRYGLNNIESEHVCGVRCKYMADFFKKLWEENVGADFDVAEYEPDVALRILPDGR